MPTGYMSTATLRRKTRTHDRGPGRVQRVDRIAFDADLKSKITHDNGMVDYHGVATRGGVAFVYEEPEGEVREFRPWAEVSDPRSLAGLAGAPYTVDHPGDGVDDDQGLGEVTVANARGLVHGVVLSVEPEQATGLVKVWVRVWTPEAIEAIEGGKVELSCGYTTELVNWREPAGADLVRAMDLGPELGLAANGERYDLVQTQIVYNHISGVDEGRAGPVARLRTDSKATMQTKTTIKIDKRGSYSVPTWVLDAAVAVAKTHTDAGEVLEVQIEGRDLMTLPIEMVDTMLAAVGIGGGGAASAGPSMPEPAADPITADAGEELEPTADASPPDEELPKMDKAIAKMVADTVAAALAKAMPAAAAQVTDAVVTKARDRADLERLAAPALGAAFDYAAHPHGADIAVAVLKADKSPRLAQAEALAARARKGDAKAEGKLEAWMEASLKERRDKLDSSGRLGESMFEHASEQAEGETEAPSTFRTKSDALRRSSTGKGPKAESKAA